MDVEFASASLDRLETDPRYDAGFSREIVRAYRMRMQQIRGASDERTLRALKSLHFEKLKGNRAGQHSIRLNSQWRLVFALKGQSPQKAVVVVEIVDYHG